MSVAEQQQSKPTVTTAPSWSVAKRIAFRFICPYFALYHLDWLTGVPGRAFNQRLYRGPMRALDGWVAIHVFHLDPSVLRLGYGGNTDTPLAYIHNLMVLLIAAVTAIVWSLLDRKHLEYRSLHWWVRLLVRYSVASSLLWYGFTKILVRQFSPASIYMSRLVDPIGNMSPIGLLWVSIGYSTPYQIFGGIAEVVPATLLLFRRTTTLGSLLSVGVLLNVVMLNFCYGVEIKLFSLNLLLATVFLAAPDLASLTRFLILKKAVGAPEPSGPLFERRSIRIAAAAVKIVFLSNLLYYAVLSSYRDSFLRVPSSRPALYGLYDVETFVRNGSERQPLTTDPVRWKRINIDDDPTTMLVQMMDDSFHPYKVEYEKTGESVTVLPGVADRRPKYVLQCSRPDKDHLVITGQLGDDSLTIGLKRIDVSKFRLLNSGFRWTGPSNDDIRF